MVKSKKVLGIIIVIILAFSLGTVGGYYLFKLKSNNSVIEDKKDNTLDSSLDKKEEDSSKEIKLSLDDEIVKELYARKTNFHTSKKVTYETLSDQKKLGVDLDGLKKKSFNLDYKEVCEKLKKSGNQDMIANYNNCVSLQNSWEGYEDIVTYYSIEEVRENNIKYFNESNNLPKEYSYVMLTTLELKPDCEKVVLQEDDNYYLDVDVHCGYGGLTPVIDNVLTSASKKDDEIILYDTYVLGLMSSDDDKVYYTFYKDEDSTGVIKTLEVNVTDDGIVYDKSLLENSKQTYKHTYKKNRDGNYYWVSSEPIKE